LSNLKKFLLYCFFGENQYQQEFYHTTGSISQPATEK
jgi:hypothetical protein